MANNNADGEIVLGLQIAETTQLIQSQLNQLSKNLSLLITGKLDYAKTSSQLKKDLKNLKENINLIGSIDKSKLKKDVQAAVSQVQVAPKIDTGALQKQIEKVSTNPNVEGNSELQQMGNNLDSINKKSAATVASVGLLNQAFRTLQNTAKQMIRTAAELDQQLTDLRMVTGQNYEDASRLVDSYNALAKELGATTSQVVDAADEWLRQGKSIAEVEQLIAQSMVLSKVGKMDSADATKNLTSAMKGYGLAVDEVSGIVDKLTAIDLQAAVSSSDLAIAMSRTASSASMAGVSMDKLLGYLAVMKETTQSSAEEIGTAMRSIFARLQNVKVGKFVDDETGEAINDVEKALGKIGIALRDTNGDFRNMETVLDEVAAKWDSLTNLEQSAIATSIAGTRQRNQFLILMQNYGKALEYAEVATNSEGTAMKKFAAYQESVEAHFNSLIASAEALSKQTFPPELLNGFIDAGAAVLDFLEATNLLTIALSTLGAALTMKGLGVFGSKIKSIYQSVTNLSAAFNILSKSANVKLSTEQFNQLLTVTKGLNAQQLKLVVSNKALTTEQRMMILTASGLTKEEAQQTLATMGLTTAEGAATTATFSLSGAFKALGAAIAANPIGFLVMALTTAITVISTVNNKLAEARQEIIDTGNEAAEHANNLIELANTYFALADAVDAGTAAKEDMLAAQDDIIKALGLEGQSVDELIDKYGDLQTAIKTVTLEQLDTDISQAIKGAKTAKKDVIGDLETWLGTGSITSNKDSEKAIIKWLYDQGLTTSDSIVSLPHADYVDFFSDLSFEDLKENRDFLEKAMNAVRKQFGSDSDVFNRLSDAYDNYADVLDPAVKAIDNANKLIAQYYVAAARGIDDPKTQSEFEQFKKNIVEQLNSDFDFDENGSFTAEGLIDSILQNDRLYSQFYQGVEDALQNTETSVQEHGNKIKETLSTLWNAERFKDTKKSILELANNLDGITADNINDLASSSGELAALLEQDGMSARFLAHILQTEAMGGDGFALITDDALTLNEALEGLRGRFDEVTDAKSRYDAAMKAPEKDTDFKSYVEAFETLNEQFVAGTTNSNAFWAAAEFLFGEDQLQEWGWSEGLDEIYEAMKKNVSIFKDADSAGSGFLDKLYAMSEAGEIKADDGSVIAEIKKLSDGSYDFQFDSANLDALADKLGITSEAALACMEALSMYGDFNFYDIDAVMDAVEEIGLASDSIDGTAVNVGTLTDQLISLGYTNKDIYDLLNVLREVDGVTLLDANANVETLTQSLSDLGLAAQDGVEVTINADGLAELMSQLNFTKEDTQGLITKLGEADGITLTNAQGEVIDLNTALENTDKLKFASVTSELDGITNSADLAQQAVTDLQRSINTLKGKTVIVTVDVQRKNSILGGIFGYAKGTSDAPEGDALVGEKGEELVQSGDRAYLVGTNGPEIAHLNEGDIVYTAEQTKKIKRGSTVIKGVVPAYAGGRINTNKGYTSVLPDSKSSNSTSTKTTTQQIKDAADATADLEEKLEETLKKMKESMDDIIGDFEHQIFLMEKNGASASEIVAVYKQMQEAVHQQAEEYRKLGLDENSDYIQDLQKQWWEYQDSIKDVIIDAYDDIVGELENSVTLTENWLDNAIADSDYGAIVKYTSDIVDYYRQMQDAIHQQAEYYRSLGYSDTSDEVSKLSDLWWDYYEKIKETSANAWQQVLDNAHDAIDEITGLYDTLRSAAEEFSEVGQISVSTFQSIAKLGIENLAYLQDENGMLVINEANIQKVIAARTQQMAIETALNYVQQLRQAQENGEIATLANLTLATQVTTQSTWDLVYAQLRLLGLQDEYFDGALQNINNLRSLSDMVAPNFSQLQAQIKETNEVAKKALEDQEDALNDLLKYVEEMIKQEVKNQVKALEDQVDTMKEIVSLQKKSLDLEKEKDKYTQTVADKEKGIADLRKQIAALDLDDSREAAAQKAKLQEELSDKINDLADYQSDHAYDAASDMLDDMADSYEREKKKEIEILENSISSEEKLYQLAIERINNHWDTLYQDLINWNYEYGSVTNDEITSAWNNASAAVQQYGGYLNAVLETQRQIAALEAASANPPSIDTGGKNPPVGKPGDYDTSGGATMDEIKRIVAQMKANSAQHGSEDAAGKLRLNKANLALGEQLAKLIGRVVVRGDDGVWYLDRVGGKRLYSTYPYSTYHTGGVAGDNPTLKQNEVFAKLKKGEVVLTEEQQQPIYEILDFADTMLGKYGALFGAVQSTDLIGSKIQEQIKQDAQQAQSIVEQKNISIENNLTIPVQVLQKLDASEIKKLTKDISKHTVSEINDVFRKNGMDSVLNPLRPR
ncbi:phage tail tape measure protein [Clostridiaceae bacterium]|nr:phage tail tape measure protein [Clostridiaceae bacterium]